MSSAAQRERHAQAVAERRRAFELNPAQYEFVYDDEHKFPAFIGGIGSGKSFAGAIKALRKTVELPGSLGVIGAPNYPQLRDSTMRTVFDIFPPALIQSFNKNERLLNLTNGSEILFKSMSDPDSLRGPNIGWFWLDEGPLCGYGPWKIMKGRLRQAGFLERVQGWLTGTPRGEDEFWEDFEHELKPQHVLYRASTRENLHNLPATFIEDLGYAGKFAQQEIEGLFVNFEGLVYEFRSEWHLGEWVGKQPDGSAVRPRLKIGGVDWGRTNPAVALPLYVSADERIYQLDEFYQRNAGFLGNCATVGEGGLSRAVADFTRDYGIQVWYCGPDEPEHISNLNAMFGRMGLKARAVAAVDDINPGIETVSSYLALKDGRSSFQMSATCAMTKAEFRAYSYPSQRAAGQRDPQEKPVKAFNHAMDALRYAMHSALGGKTRHRPVPDDANQRMRPDQRISEVGGVQIMRKVF